LDQTTELVTHPYKGAHPGAGEAKRFGLQQLTTATVMESHGTEREFSTKNKAANNKHN